jgi:hypothetical protein
VSQMPDMAGGWPEEGTQYVPGAPAEPVQQQPYPQQQAPYPQSYPQQGYPGAQYGQSMPQQQYAPVAQPPYQEQTVPQPAMFVEEERSSVPSEFDHLFRDSSPENRRSISGRQPVVSGPGASAPAFAQSSASLAQQPMPAAGPGGAATALHTPPQGHPGAQAPAYEDRGPAEYGLSQPFGGGYGGPGGPAAVGGARRRTPLIVGGVVVVVAAVGLYLGLSGGSGGGKSPQAAPSTSATATVPHETAQQQAAAVYQLVQQATTLRNEISSEVSALKSCHDVASLQSEIDKTASARQTLATQVSALDVSKISDGAALAAALHSAWMDSYSSDEQYAQAAADVAAGCTSSAVTSDSHYRAANTGSGQSTSDKEAAVSLWNKTMTNYGQPKISQYDL